MFQFKFLVNYWSSCKGGGALCAGTDVGGTFLYYALNGVAMLADLVSILVVPVVFPLTIATHLMFLQVWVDSMDELMTSER